VIQKNKEDDFATRHGIKNGDTLKANLSCVGTTSLKVVTHGADGFVGEDSDGKKHNVLWSHVIEANSNLIVKAFPKILFLRNVIKPQQPLNTPTPAQAEAGNYKKRKLAWHGLIISIENEAGSIRKGKGWQTKMLFPYGYINSTEGSDGDQVDVYVGPDEDSDTVYVVHQRKYGDWERYDEDKCLLNFSSEADARAAYLKHYDDPRFLGPITAMPVAEFVEKARKADGCMVKAITPILPADDPEPLFKIESDCIEFSPRLAIEVPLEYANEDELSERWALALHEAGHAVSAQLCCGVGGMGIDRLGGEWVGICYDRANETGSRYQVAIAGAAAEALGYDRSYLTFNSSDFQLARDELRAGGDSSEDEIVLRIAQDTAAMTDEFAARWLKAIRELSLQVYKRQWLNADQIGEIMGYAQAVLAKAISNNPANKLEDRRTIRPGHGKKLILLNMRPLASGQHGQKTKTLNKGHQ
jgi:hypothetical protein